ncbi:helix-turn-helix domain-containing protein [Reyranella sp.]|uniref:helix-turn-helix domain-containing protein n=1 Tax=Reyranella sp. TaxID=1929291 RepID=UPI003BA8E37F
MKTRYRWRNTVTKLRKPSNALLTTLASNVRFLRQAKGLSQEALADQCGIHRTYVGSIERRERNVTLSSLELLASALRVSVVQLLTPMSHDKKQPKP